MDNVFDQADKYFIQLGMKFDDSAIDEVSKKIAEIQRKNPEIVLELIPKILDTGDEGKRQIEKYVNSLKRNPATKELALEIQSKILAPRAQDVANAQKKAQAEADKDSIDFKTTIGKDGKPMTDKIKRAKKNLQDAAKKEGPVEVPVELKNKDGKDDILDTDKLKKNLRESLFDLTNLTNQVKTKIGKMMEDAFSSPEMTSALTELGNRINKTVADAFVKGTDQARGEVAQTINAIKEGTIKPLTDVMSGKDLKNGFNELVNSDAFKAFQDLADKLNALSLGRVKEILEEWRGLSRRDRGELGLVSQRARFNLSKEASERMLKNQAKNDVAYREYLAEQNALAAKQKEYFEKDIAVKQAELDFKKTSKAQDEAREAAAKAKEEEEARRKREERRALYERNVGIAMDTATEAMNDNPDLAAKKRLDLYNRSVQRIAGIYQSAVLHGRVENPQTIYAGIAELHQRSAAITNAKLSEQMGIDDLKKKLKETIPYINQIGQTFNRVASIIENINNAFATMRNVANQITRQITSLLRNVLNRVTNQIKSITQSAISAYQSLQTSMIGFSHFFGEEKTNELTSQIKAIAAKAPGIDTAGLAEYVRQIAPVSGGDSNLALNASLGMLKTIQYGGANGSTEMEYVIKNIRDVLAKGKATQIDLRQFNRAMPVLEKVLADIGESQLIKDGKLNITKDNVDTILSAFARLNTAKNSPVAGIYEEINQTLGGQWEQLTEQFRTNVMEMFENSGIFGQMIKLLRQFNSGEYAGTALVRLGKVLKNFVDNINWFKVQDVASKLWDDLKIIGEGLKDAMNTIRQAIGDDSVSLINSFAKWVADIIRGMGEGIAQVVRFVKYLKSTGAVDGITKLIGWMGSAGATLASAFSQFTMNMLKMVGNATQLVSRLQSWNVSRKLASLQTQLDAIPTHLRTATITKEDLINGQGLASPANSVEANAINTLTQVVNTHFKTTEGLIAQGNQVKGIGLPDVETGVSRGGTRIIRSDTTVGTYNKKTGQYDYVRYASGNKEFDTNFAKQKYQELLKRNKLEESGNGLLTTIGASSLVKNKIEPAIDTIKNKVIPKLQSAMAGLFKAAGVMMFTEVISAAIVSMNMFGDASENVAAVLKAAATAIAGAVVGASVGGIAGGIVGALVGLGIGVVNLVNTINAKEEELRNSKFNKTLTEGQQKILNAVEEGLIAGGRLNKDITGRTDEESYAFQQVARTIQGTGMAELSEKLKKDPKYLYRIYSDALVYKTIGMNSTNQNTGEGFDWNDYKAATGKGVNPQTDRATMSRMAALISKYDLAANQGWYRDKNGNYYNDANFTSAVSGESIWRAYFGDTEITKQGVDAFEQYLTEQEKIYAPLKDVDTKTEAIQDSVKKLTGNEPETYLDNTTGKILSETEKANNTLIEIAANGKPNGTSNTGLWSRNADEQGKIRKMSEKYNSVKGDAAYYWSTTGFDHDGKRNRDKLLEEARQEGASNYRVNYDLDYIFDRINRILTGNIKADLNDNQRQLLEQFRNDMLNRDYDSDTAGSLIDWIKAWRNSLLDAGLKYSVLAFAGGGSVIGRGIDTVPAMLAPGEFVVKPSSVKKAGLGAMFALNHGDLGYAARLLGGSVSNSWYKNNNAQINNSRNSKTNINNIQIFNRSNSGRLNSYYSLANRLSF